MVPLATSVIPCMQTKAVDAAIMFYTVLSHITLKIMLLQIICRLVLFQQDKGNLSAFLYMVNPISTYKYLHERFTMVILALKLYLPI